MELAPGGDRVLQSVTVEDLSPVAMDGRVAAPIEVDQPGRSRHRANLVCGQRRDHRPGDRGLLALAGSSMNARPDGFHGVGDVEDGRHDAIEVVVELAVASDDWAMSDLSEEPDTCKSRSNVRVT